MYRKDYFSPEQWAELEKVLSHQQISTKNESLLQPILIICGSIVLTAALILLVYYLTQRKITKNKIS